MSEIASVASYGDLVADELLGVRAADAIASALDRVRDRDVDVLYVPRPLAEETVLDPEDGTDSVFVAELLDERETGDAFYARQGQRGCWLPKGATRIYVEADGATIDMPDSAPETEGSA